jgi:hypothetical protein
MIAEVLFSFGVTLTNVQLLMKDKETLSKYRIDPLHVKLKDEFDCLVENMTIVDFES